jgi:heme/copper-type cytochrome/quinol oxidase subunit 4
MSNIDSAARASRIYNNAKAIASGSVDLEVSGTTVGILMMLGFLYLTVSALGIDIYSKCTELQGKKTQENLKHYLGYTLTIGLVIPFTLLLTKFVKNEGAVFGLLYSIMGLIGSAVALNYSVKCKNADKSAKAWSGVSLTIYVLTLAVSGYFLSKRASIVK